MTPLRILFATPECAPWVKTGGLGDVCGALPKALTALGHDVRVLIPAFPAFRPLLGEVSEPSEVRELPAQGAWPAARLMLVEARGIQLWLLDCPALYERPSGPYLDHTGRDFVDNAERFGLLSHVAAWLSGPDSPCPDWRVDVLHCHDWTTALAPAYLSHSAPQGKGRAATVLTIHNLAFQGMFPSHLATTLAMPPDWLTVDPGLLHWDRLCFLKGGLRFADRITTVSPTYAQEIQREPEGCGLDGMLRWRAAHLTGILNGIDTEAWHPAHDAHIAVPYDVGCLDKKAANKAALQARMGLAVREDAMLLGLVSRLTRQKGIELVVQVLPALVSMGCQLCVLGAGDADLEAVLSDLAAAYPSMVAVRLGFDEGLAHLIEAGADAFLMPSIFEPCGLSQMYSQAYGTPPIVHAVGGLADSVQERDRQGEGGEAGNGFVFHAPSGEALLSAIARAHACYRDPKAWRAVQRAGMALDHGWGRSAAQYEAVYRAALADVATDMAAQAAKASPPGLGDRAA